MKTSLKILLVLALLLVIGIGGLLWWSDIEFFPPPEQEPEPKQTIEQTGPGELTIYTDFAQVHYQKLLDAITPDVRKIIITSPGGNVQAAIGVANKIFDYKIEMVVKSHCMSSCANYLVPAAAKATVLPESLLCIHGGAVTEDNPATKLLLKDTVDAEAALFKKIGVDPQLYMMKEANEQIKKLHWKDFMFWCPAKATWEKYQVRHWLSFWYPKDQAAMTALIHRIANERATPGRKPEPLYFVGDYN